MATKDQNSDSGGSMRAKVGHTVDGTGWPAKVETLNFSAFYVLKYTKTIII